MKIFIKLINTVISDFLCFDAQENIKIKNY